MMAKKGMARRGWGGQAGRGSQPKPERLICQICGGRVTEDGIRYQHVGKRVHEPVPTFAD